MTAVSPAASAALMQALQDTLDAGGAALVQIYAGTRPSPGASGGAPMASVALAQPCGSVNTGTGVLSLAPSAIGQITASAAPTWARLLSGAGAWVLDCDARLAGSADAGEALVIDAPALYPGAFVRIASGSFSL